MLCYPQGQTFGNEMCRGMKIIRLEDCKHSTCISKWSARGVESVKYLARWFKMSFRALLLGSKNYNFSLAPLIFFFQRGFRVRGIMCCKLCSITGGRTKSTHQIFKTRFMWNVFILQFCILVFFFPHITILNIERGTMMRNFIYFNYY